MAGVGRDQGDAFKRRTGITPQDFDLLGRIPLFAGLRRERVEALLRDAWAQHFPRNTVLFLEGEPAPRFYIVTEGWVKLLRQSADGQESVVAVFTRGESFAEAAILEAGVYPVSAVVATKARLIVVPAGSFLAQLREDSDVALNMLASMSRHLRHLVIQLQQRTLESSTQRVADFLLRLCPVRAGPAVVHLPVDKALIAARLGMQPETLSRTLAKFRDFGVATKGDEIAISDAAVLRELREPPAG